TGTGEYWEYRWALVAKATLWAADKLPQGQIKALSPTTATIANPADESLRLHAAWDTPDGLVGAFERAVAPGANVTVSIPDAGNLRFARGPIVLRARLLNAKGEALDIAAAPLPGSTPRIHLAMLTLPATASPGDLVSGSFQCQADAGAKPRLDIMLTDAFGRVVDLQTLRPGTGKSAHEFSLSVRTPLSVFHRLSVTAYDEVDGGEPVVAALLEKPLLVPAAARGHLDDFQLGAGYAVMHILCQPYLLDSFVAFLRKHGVTACTVNRTFIERGMPAWGGTLSGGGMAHKADDSTRPHCFSDPKKVDELCQRTVANARRRQAWGYLGYNMHDEVHLHQQGKVETCDNAACVAAFRIWAQSCYGTIAEANKEWGTNHAEFAAVGMPRIENMKEGQNPAQWIDYRLFMERVWANAYAQAHTAVREACPNVNLSFTNPYRYNALSGTNFELWTPHEEVLLRYFHRHVADRCRSWSDAPMLAWIGYRTRAESLRKFMWEFAFQGGAMPIWWDPILPWAYSGKRGFTPWYMFGPLWRETGRSQAVSAPALELERGLGRVLRTANRVPADVVILHSQASMHLTYVQAALAEGQITHKGTKAYRASDEAMARAIQCQSFPYRYARVTTLEEDLANAKIVALPSCHALDDPTVATLKRFVERGGRLLADTMPATHTGHGRPRTSSPLTSLFDGKRGFCLGKPADSASQGELIFALAELTPLPTIAVRTPQGTPPARMRLFRYRLGSAEVVGIVQGVGDDAEPALTLRLPNDKRQVYDMRRGVLLGKTGASRSLKLIPGDAAIFALLPYRPGALAATVKANARTLEIQVQLADTPTDAVHVFRIDITRPGDPAPCHWYSRNVVAPAGAATFDVPLAQNDPAGTWQIQIRDLLTGTKTSRDITVSAKTLQ
ncbi:MAG: beta-galactosidase, partial [Lentisphaeria bacterium]|nr:beta-galactosidase [Lentisphaeria bacterium]